MKYLFSIIIFLMYSGAINAQDSTDDNKNAILNERMKSNLALKSHRIDSVLMYLTDDINISASNGKVFTGKTAFREALLTVFGEYPDLYFVRNADEVLLNEEETIAWEKGTWIALRPDTDDWNNCGGKYAASWIKTGGIWKIKSELFVRLD